MTLILSRRHLLAGATAMLAFPAHAAADDDLRSVLDGFPREGDPAAQLSALAGFDPARLSPPARLDLLTVRAGLAVDRDIRQRFPDSGHAPMTAADRTDWFALQLRRKLGDVDPAMARRRLQIQLDSLLRRADRSLARAVLQYGSTGTRFGTLFGTGLYSDDDAGRDRAIADMNRALDVQRGQVGLAFDDVPAWTLDVRVVRLTHDEKLAGGRG
jgi:hypothetical protein